jgi:uncharacterized protein (DUF302 family)
MSYHLSKTLDMPIDRAEAKARETLQKNGFGVLTEIDVQQTMKKKLDADLYPYRILGACNPKMAFQALQAEDKVGTMLPCNVILQEREPGRTEISAVDPIASMQAIDNPKLGEIATSVRAMLQKVVADVGT